MKRKDIKDCPENATHLHLNPSNEFIQMFYKIDETGVAYQTFSGSWAYSDSAEKDPEFIKKLIEIE